MNELKAEIIINAGIRAAERNFANAYVIKKGDSEAGAIFIKIDTLDGYAKLYSRNLVYDFDKNKNVVQFQDLYPNKKTESRYIDMRITKEISIDRDCWIVEIEDKKGFNPFHNLDC
ncbi:DUF1491 family protein [Alphaproteobacteria bacterium]|nr:DUF1491 family protein [Alphaproteobacteria bacterium]